MKLQSAWLGADEVRSRVFGSLPAVIYTTDPENRFVGPRFVSDPMSAIVGYDRQAFISNEQLWPSRIHGDDLPRVLAQVSSISLTGMLTMEYRWRCADGTEKLFFDQAILDSDRTTPTICGICLDISSGMSRVAAAQTSGATDHLSEIRHELNNMVSVILWNIEPLARSLKDDGKAFDRVQNALQAVARCLELVQQLPKSD